MFALELARGKAQGMEAYGSQAKRRGVQERRQRALGLLALLNPTGELGRYESWKVMGRR
jgi:hypothetical protein